MKVGDLVELAPAAKRCSFWTNLFGSDAASVLGLVLGYDPRRHACEIMWTNGLRHICVGAEDLVKA